MNQNIQIGDRVELLGRTAGEREGILPVGATGTVVGIYNRFKGVYHVQWDRRCLPRGGHGCDGLCPYGTGWNVLEKEIAIVEPQETADEFFSCAELL